MNLDHDFVQESKLSEDQKKRLSPKMNTFFSQIQMKTKKKGLHQKRNTFFPRFQVDTYAQMHTRVKLLGRYRSRPYSNYWVGYSQIIEGYTPPSPGFGTPAFRPAPFINLGCNERKTNSG